MPTVDPATQSTIRLGVLLFCFPPPLADDDTTTRSPSRPLLLGRARDTRALVRDAGGGARGSRRSLTRNGNVVNRRYDYPAPRRARRETQMSLLLEAACAARATPK